MSNYYEGTTEGPKDWDKEPEPELNHELRVDVDARLHASPWPPSPFDHRTAVICREDDFCPSCKFLRKEQLRSGNRCSPEFGIHVMPHCGCILR